MNHDEPTPSMGNFMRDKADELNEMMLEYCCNVADMLPDNPEISVRVINSISVTSISLFMGCRLWSFPDEEKIIMMDKFLDAIRIGFTSLIKQSGYIKQTASIRKQQEQEREDGICQSDTDTTAKE